MRCPLTAGFEGTGPGATVPNRAEVVHILFPVLVRQNYVKRITKVKYFITAGEMKSCETTFPEYCTVWFTNLQRGPDYLISGDLGLTLQKVAPMNES